MVFVGMVANAVYQVGDAQLAGTVFEEGAWLYVVYGAVLSALGRSRVLGSEAVGPLDPRQAGAAAGALGFLATVLASLPYLIAGFAKQPANASEFDYAGPQNLWNGLCCRRPLADVRHGARLRRPRGAIVHARAPAAGDDPWDGQTLEWATSSPAPYANFADVHTVASAEPLLDLKPRRDR